MGRERELYPGRSEVLEARFVRLEEGDEVGATYIHSLDAAFRVQLRVPAPWSQTKRQTQAGALRFPRAARGLWPDIPAELLTPNADEVGINCAASGLAASVQGLDAQRGGWTLPVVFGAVGAVGLVLAAALTWGAQRRSSAVVLGAEMGAPEWDSAYWADRIEDRLRSIEERDQALDGYWTTPIVLEPEKAEADEDR